MKKFKKLLALGLSVGVLASSMICASAAEYSLDELIKAADSRVNWSLKASVREEEFVAQLAQIDAAMKIAGELHDLKDLKLKVSDGVLDNYADRLMSLGVRFYR